MNLQLNGKPYAASPGLNVLALLQELQLNSQQVVVELNGRILTAGQLAQTALTKGDTIEIIQFVGGG